VSPVTESTYLSATYEFQLCAERCRNFARQTCDVQTSETLLKLAADFEVSIRLLQRSNRSDLGD